jgi:2-amino-4-hydroxy-6-hydroxymethyldihydropteridine diphosphokinase
MAPRLVPVEHKVTVTRVFVGLGSNLGDRELNLRRALQQLEELGTVRASSFRETDPVGVTDQPKFLNAAVELATDLSPKELLERLLEIERELGRDRATERRWGPRVIDLDLLLFGEDAIDEPGLRVPHPRLADRRFVLEPLCELNEDLTLPDGTRVRDLLASWSAG